MKTVEIINKNFGTILEKSFSDETQMKIFLKLIHISIVRKESLDYYDGYCDFIHVPFDILDESLIVSKQDQRNLSDYFYMNQKKNLKLVDNSL
jgi:hypothetical protein